MSPATENPESEQQLWLVCPICKQPNPAGTYFCKHCWGPSLRPIKPVSSQELVTVMEQNKAHAKRMNTIRVITISVLAPLLLSIATFLYMYLSTDVIFGPNQTLNSNPSLGDWSMFHRDVSHSGNTGTSTISPQGTLKWTFSTDAPIKSSPAVVAGTVYFGSNDKKLHAVDAETGTQLWEFETEGFIWSSPAVANGVVYFGSNDGNLYALDALTGNELWRFETRYTIESSPAIADDKIYFGSGDYLLYVLDATTGEKLWEFQTEGAILSSPTISNGIVYITSFRFLYALNAEDGRFRLGYRTPREIYSSPTVYKGIVYFNCDSFLYAVKSNARNWPNEYAIRSWWLQFYVVRLAPPPPPLSGHVGKLTLSWSRPMTTRSSPVVSEDTLYTCAGRNVYALDPVSGETKWTFLARGLISSTPAAASNALYLSSTDGRLYAIDISDGSLLWDFSAGPMASSPALDNGVVYVGSEDGNLYAIE